MKYLASILLIISSTSLSTTANASDFHSARTAALGGAGHANPLLSDAIYLNPSYASFIQTHSLSATLQKFNDPGSESSDGRLYNVSVLDGAQDSLFQAGLGFTQRQNKTFIHIASSKNLSDHFGIGIGTKLFFPNGQPSGRFTDTTFSLTAIFSNWFQAALIVDNILQNGTSQNLYREAILGTKINIKSIVLIYLDPHWLTNPPSHQNSFGYEAGVEFPFFSDFFLRAGKFQNSFIPYLNQRTHGFGLGAGWLGPKLSLDYGFSKLTERSNVYSHHFGVTLYF